MYEALVEAERMGVSEAVLSTGYGPAKIVKLTAALGFLPIEIREASNPQEGESDGRILWKAPVDSAARDLIKKRDPGKQVSEGLTLRA